MISTIASFIQYYSLSDDFFIYSFLFIVALYLVVDWLIQRFRKFKSRGNFLLFRTSQQSNLENYTFGFEPRQMEMASEVSAKKLPLFHKVILATMVIAIVFVPFYEFVETLRPAAVMEVYGCLL